MVAWCCGFIFPVLGTVFLGVGLVLFLGGEEQELTPDALNYFVAGGVFAGLFVLNFLIGVLVKYKATAVKKGQGYPDERALPWKIAVALWAAFMTIVVTWPIAYIIQTLFVLTLGWFVPESWYYTITGSIWRASANLFSVWLNPFWKVNVIKRPSKGIPTNTILMSNHLTFSDAFILSSQIYPIEAKFVATSWVFKLPFGGWMSIRAGDLAIKFKKVDPAENNGKNFVTDKDVVKATMKRAGEYVTRDMRMAVFPEGSLSKSGEMLPFRDGFFKLAIDNECSITPCAMWGNQSLWLHGGILPQPGYAELAIGDAIQASKADTVEGLKSQVRAAITELRDGLPLYQKTGDRKSTLIGKTSQWATKVPENFL